MSLPNYKMDEEFFSEEKIRDLIFRTVKDVLFCIAIEKKGTYRFLSVNRGFLNVTGLKQSEVIGKLVQEVIPAQSLPLTLSKYKAAIEERCSQTWQDHTSDSAG